MVCRRHVHSHQQKSDDVQAFICCSRNRFKCSAQIKVKIQDGEAVEILGSSGNHNHEPDVPNKNEFLLANSMHNIKKNLLKQIKFADYLRLKWFQQS